MQFYTISVVYVDIFFLSDGEECVILEECDITTCFLELEFGVQSTRLPVERSDVPMTTYDR